MDKTEPPFIESLYGNLPCHFRAFQVAGHDYLLAVTALQHAEADYRLWIAQGLPDSLSEHSYEVKFDRQNNVEDENYFSPPGLGEIPLNWKNMRVLAKTLRANLQLHMDFYRGEEYIFIAESERHVHFYNRFLFRQARDVDFRIISGLPPEGKKYVIKRISQEKRENR